MALLFDKMKRIFKSNRAILMDNIVGTSKYTQKVIDDNISESEENLNKLNNIIIDIEDLIDSVKIKYDDAMEIARQDKPDFNPEHIDSTRDHHRTKEEKLAIQYYKQLQELDVQLIDIREQRQRLRKLLQSVKASRAMIPDAE